MINFLRYTAMDYLFPHYFDRIVVINLTKNPERFARIADELKYKCLAGPDDIVRHEAVHGDSMPHPAWYRAGNGAWGCLSSHIEALEDAWNTGSEHTLIIEDDAVFANDLLTRFPETMKEVPKEYGQLYLGGQHQQAPEALSDTLWRGTSVNRTHCYAVTRKFIPEILAHIMDWDTHIKAAGNPLHIDHTLEIGHQRRYWPVFCPRFWFAGQGENQSDINGRPQREMWWEYSVKQQHLELPLLVLRTADMPEHVKDLAFVGWPSDLDARGVNRKIEEAKKTRLPCCGKSAGWRMWDSSITAFRRFIFRNRNRFPHCSVCGPVKSSTRRMRMMRISTGCAASWNLPIIRKC